MICFVKEALSIRGIPDIIGCINGKFFCLEVKRDESEAKKKTGRIVLQKKFIKEVKAVGGFGAVIHPQNEDKILRQLFLFGDREP